ncbi:hypothetical protein BVRB_018760, partial [Beta vulgaris subsp. vulgaris]
AAACLYHAGSGVGHHERNLLQHHLMIYQYLLCLNLL